MHSDIHWKAVYDDGTELTQFNEDGSENKYPDIDRRKLAFFELYNKEKLIFRLHLEKGRRLIVRRRVIAKGKLGGKLIPTQVIWLVGWQWNANGRNVQDIAFIFDDGHVELLGRWKGSPFDAPGSLMKCEYKRIGTKEEKKPFGVGAVLKKEK